MGKSGALGQLLYCFFPRRRRRDAAEGTMEENHVPGNPDGGSVSLPDDIIFFDVLSRLPVKSLCRFRCVCRAWRAVISDADPAFAAARRSRAAPLVVAVFGPPYPISMFLPSWAPRYRQGGFELRVIDTADGSVLRAVWDVESAKLSRAARLDLVYVDQGVHGGRVVDPETGRVVAVVGIRNPQGYPVADPDGAPYKTMCPRLCHSSFGRAAPSGTYKVVHLRDASTEEHGETQVCMVSVIGEEPVPVVVRRQRREPPFLTCCCSYCTVTVDGVVYFLDRGAPAHGAHPGGPPASWNRIAVFDLESEEWKTTIDGPPVGSPNREEKWEMALAELRKGTLCLVQMIGTRRRCQGDRCANVWLLVDSVWVKEYEIQMPKTWIMFRAIEILGDGRILTLNGFKEDGDEYYWHARCILQLYDANTGTLTDLMEMTQDLRGLVTLYTGSFLSSSTLSNAFSSGEELAPGPGRLPPCDVHGVCGRYGVCTYLPRLSCSCPDGYVARDQGDWSKGCKRQFDLRCSDKVRFDKMPHVDFYGFDFNYTSGLTFDECRQICLDDCNCEAFGYKKGSGECLPKIAMWNGKVPDPRQAVYLKVPTRVRNLKPTVPDSHGHTCNVQEREANVSSSYLQVKGNKINFAYFYWFLAVVFVVEAIFMAVGYLFVFRAADPAPAAWAVRVDEEGYALLDKISCEPELEELLDPRLRGDFSQVQAAVMLELALSCVDEDPNRRPSMNTVLHKLLSSDDP
ncbi:hypothetical protein EJB05_21526, partial [Eragrostis curvula]